MAVRILQLLAVSLVMTLHGVRAVNNMTESAVTTPEMEVTTEEVGIPPRITKQPMKNIMFHDFDEGMAATLDCEASGEPRPQYQWYKNGEPFNAEEKDNVEILTPTEGKMIINPVDKMDEGYYQCRATNTYGSILSVTSYLQRATLQIPLPGTPTVYDVREGKPLKVECEILRSVPQSVQSWSVASDTSDLTPVVFDKRIQMDDYGHLYFSYVEASDSTEDRTFKCRSTNPFLDLSNEHSPSKLNITLVPDAPDARPELMFQSGGDEQDSSEESSEDSEEKSKDEQSAENGGQASEEDDSMENEPRTTYVYAKAGSDAQLTCIFSGKPEVEVQWRRESGELGDNQQPDATGRHLKMLQLSEDKDDDTYTCTGKNNLGEVSATIVLKVQDAPVFEQTDFTLDSTVSAGSDAKFECDTEAEPDATVTWYINGEQVTDGGRYEVDDDELEIRDVCLDCGEFTRGMLVIQCNASNSYGYVMGSGHLLVSPSTDASNAVVARTGTILAGVFVFLLFLAM